MPSRPARLALVLTTSALFAGLLVAPATDSAVAATSSRAPLDILVLGDSYSAGNGATDDSGAVQTYGPDGCRRSRVNWSEKYAAALRASGQPVRLVNHACSGGVTADITSPRVMDTASKVETAPAGVTTTAQADASLARRDPCNTHAFPDEEFWTYHATSVNLGVVSYDCTRNLRPQARFVNSNVDLVLFTMGGNDAGFSSIVQDCFVVGVRTSSGCKGRVDTARALLPQIQQRLRTDIAAIRAHGLREDAKLVQLGYPWLQTDNDFTLSDPPGYAAGDEVRSLVSAGDAAIAAIVPGVNAGHPGQLSFLAGVPEKFAGHEPDAATPMGNADRWVNQVGDGDAIEVWYHPNRLGQTAYAQMLQARGTFGAPTSPPVVTHPGVRATLRARLNRHRVHAGHRVRLRIAVTLSNRARPRGRVIVRDVATHRRLAAATLHRSNHGKVRLRFRLRHTGTTTIDVLYRDPVAPAVHTTRSIRVVR
ncbi:MAG: hypothetical protein JWR90_2273 [Marmoricola sp.]|jgi:lysophospholipase L1-like esterase|nr:hypothetical protein [Marmoricola sp.]